MSLFPGAAPLLYDHQIAPRSPSHYETTRLRLYKPSAYPTRQFPGNPYNAGLGDRIFMPYTPKANLIGFLIRREIGPCTAGVDSPPRFEDQPLGAELQAAVRQQALAALQDKVKSIGGTGIVNLTYEVWESHCGAHERIVHCTAAGDAVIVGPIEYRPSNG